MRQASMLPSGSTTTLATPVVVVVVLVLVVLVVDERRRRGDRRLGRGDLRYDDGLLLELNGEDPVRGSG
ncbi:MAG TPA: hypothetical protein VMQ46_06610 [Acidimicrobiia bacterium]|nr:hypothetical protein [Acidimicrobiia bacterium]